jgi:hypothetical protein
VDGRHFRYGFDCSGDRGVRHLQRGAARRPWRSVDCPSHSILALTQLFLCGASADRMINEGEGARSAISSIRISFLIAEMEVGHVRVIPP